MFISELSLVNFKNINQAEFSFSSSVNCFLGNNGQGKTNLLDAIYYLSYTKSFFNSIDSQNVNFNENFFVVQGKIEDKDSTFDLCCGMWDTYPLQLNGTTQLAMPIICNTFCSIPKKMIKIEKVERKKVILPPMLFLCLKIEITR